MYNIFTNERCTYIVVYNEDSWFFVIGLAIMVCWCNYGNEFTIFYRGSLCWNISYLWNYWTVTCTVYIDTITNGRSGFLPLDTITNGWSGFLPLTSLSPPSLLLNPPSPLSTKFYEASEDSSYTQVYLYLMWRIWKNCCT